MSCDTWIGIATLAGIVVGGGIVLVQIYLFR